MGQAAEAFTRTLALDHKRAAPFTTRAHWELGLGRAYFGLGDLDGLEENALRSLSSLGMTRPQNSAQWLALLGRQTRAAGRPPGARAPASDGVDALREAALAAGLLSQRYFYLDDLTKMTAMVLLSINSAERAGAGVPVARAYTAMGGLAGLARARRLSQRYFAQAHRAADRDPSEQAMALAVEAVMAGSLGQWQRARELAVRLERLLPELRDSVILQNAITTLCHGGFRGRPLTERRAPTPMRSWPRPAPTATPNTHVGLLLRGAQSLSRPALARSPAAPRRRAPVLRRHPEDAVGDQLPRFGRPGPSTPGRSSGGGAARQGGAGPDRALRPTGFPSLAGYAAVAQVFREIDLSPPMADGSARTVEVRPDIPTALPVALHEEAHAQLDEGRRTTARVLRLLARHAAAPLLHGIRGYTSSTATSPTVFCA